MTSLIDRPAAQFGSASNLVCRECGAIYELGPSHVCEMCFGPLEIGYDPEARRLVTRASIEAGPPSMWRYQGLLPVLPLVDLRVGMTRLVPAPNLARELGMRSLWVKDDSGNPTHSFKDRVVAVAASAARALGYEVLACASTGNLANAVAAAAANSGLRSVVLIPPDLEAGKVITTAVSGG